jgi:hypothetical protein
MSATVQCPCGPMERACHAFDQIAWPGGIEPACHVERVKYIMGRICDAQSCEGHGQKTEVESCVIGQEHRVGSYKDSMNCGRTCSIVG